MSDQLLESVCVKNNCFLEVLLEDRMREQGSKERIRMSRHVAIINNNYIIFSIRYPHATKLCINQVTLFQNMED